MPPKSNLLSDYKHLLQTTNLQQGYQALIKTFRALRVSLQKAMSGYQFQKRITENGMDYAYFTFTDQALKAKGLKIAVVFVHAAFFQYEVWLSGVNRVYQTRYYAALKDPNLPFSLTNAPAQTDYLLRASLDVPAECTEKEQLVQVVKEVTAQLRGVVEGEIL